MGGEKSDHLKEQSENEKLYYVTRKTLILIPAKGGYNFFLQSLMKRSIRNEGKKVNVNLLMSDFLLSQRQRKNVLKVLSENKL